MSNDKLYKSWFKRYIKAIHRHDQYKAAADELECKNSPKAKAFRKLQEAYVFFVKISSERVSHYKKMKG